MGCAAFFPPRGSQLQEELHYPWPTLSTMHVLITVSRISGQKIYVRVVLALSVVHVHLHIRIEHETTKQTFQKVVYRALDVVSKTCLVYRALDVVSKTCLVPS